MEQLKEKIYSLLKALDDLKTIFDAPKLFITNYFADFRSQIDLAAIRFIVSKTKIQNQTEIDKKTLGLINNNWLQIIQKLNQLEQECLKNYAVNKLFSLEIKETIKVIENELNLGTRDFSRLEDLIYDQKYKLEKMLLMNQSLIFIARDQCRLDDLFAKMDLNVTFGKLILVQNEYYGRKGVDYVLRKLNENLADERVNRNEILKSTHFISFIKDRPKLKPLLSGDSVDELSIEYTKLNYINMSNQGLVSLDDNIFQDLDKLTQIQLNTNKLTHLNANTFSNLKNLTLLRLNSNKLTQLDPFLFRGLVNLEELYLNDNQLTSLDIRLFKSLTKLEILQLHGNQLASVDPAQFVGLDNLTQLTLNNNQLTQIHPDTFRPLNKLERLDLFQNKLTQLDPRLFSNLVNLTELDLHHNSLSDLDSNVFKGLARLVLIRLDANKLKHLNGDLFKDQSKLVSLGVSFNFLTHLDASLFQGMTNLRQIDAANNQLSAVDKFIFKGLTVLDCVYLSNNRFLANKKLELFLEKSVEFISFKRNTYENNKNDIVLVSSNG